MSGRSEGGRGVTEDCRSLQALKEAVVVALPKLCVEGFDVSVGGRALDDDEGIVSLEDSVCLDVSANTRGLSTLALREAGREVGEEGLLAAVREGDVGGKITLEGVSPYLNLREGDVGLCTLYLDAIDAKSRCGDTPLLVSCRNGHLTIAALLLGGSTAIHEKNVMGLLPLRVSCRYRHLEIATLLLDRGSTVLVETSTSYCSEFPDEALDLLSGVQRGHDRSFQPRL